MTSEAPLPRPAGTIRFGLVADAHAADRASEMGRFYRDAPRRLAAAAAALGAAGAEFLVELGDLKDAGRDEAETLRFLAGAAGALRAFPGPVLPVLGNHDADRITKEEFLAGFAEALGQPEPPPAHGFLDQGGVRFVRLDSDFRPDGEPYSRGHFDWRACIVPAEQLDWLRETLATAPGPAIVFIHARLEGANNCTLRNAEEVRSILQAAGNVRAVFQGHHHPGGAARIGGILFYTLPAICEGAGPYALVDVRSDGGVRVQGFAGAPSLMH